MLERRPYSERPPRARVRADRARPRFPHRAGRPARLRRPPLRGRRRRRRPGRRRRDRRGRPSRCWSTGARGRTLVEPQFTIVRGRRGRGGNGGDPPRGRGPARRRPAGGARAEGRAAMTASPPACRSPLPAAVAVAGAARRGDEPAHPAPAAGRDRADPAAAGLAEHPGDAGAGLDRPDRDLVGVASSAPMRWPAWRWSFPAS